jgi:hypothetical protein
MYVYVLYMVFLKAAEQMYRFALDLVYIFKEMPFFGAE